MNRLDGIEETQLRRVFLIFNQAILYACTFALRNLETKERLQAFEGVVIARKHGGARETITVRKTSFGVGVERIFPLHATIVDHIDVVKRGRVRRAKLYYLRGLRGKAARIRERGTRVRQSDSPARQQQPRNSSLRRSGSRRRLRIAIDAHSVGTGLGGNESYATNLIEALAEIDQTNRYTFVRNEARGRGALRQQVAKFFGPFDAATHPANSHSANSQCRAETKPGRRPSRSVLRLRPFHLVPS